MGDLGVLSKDEVATLVATSSTSSYKNSGGRKVPDWVIIRDGSGELENFEIVKERLHNEAISKLKPLVTPARMSRGSAAWSSSAVRGDSTCWVTPDLCEKIGAPSTADFIKSLIKLLKPLKQYLHIDDYSVQFAVYPGNGEGYVRHKDSFSSSQNNNNVGSNEVIEEEATRQSQSNSRGCRMITCLFYLSKNVAGGKLRVFSDKKSEEWWEDIEPKFGRMVIFRSDLVEHEVLPCFSERIAFTLWASVSSPTPAEMGVNHTTRIPTTRMSFRNPVYVTNEKSDDDGTIFVGIASYRDTECQHTVRDLYEQAEFPERVFVGIVWQCDRALDGTCFEIETNLFNSKDADVGAIREWWRNHVRYVEMPWQQARGPCIARHICKSLWRGEKYFLQTDSHMRFRGRWDSAMVSLLELARSSDTPKPILTTYPLGYTLPNNVPTDTCATYLVPTNFDKDGILRQSGRRMRKVTPKHASSKENKDEQHARVGVIPSLLWASGFSFSDASLLHEVPYDPLLEFLFFGEEISMAARLFTHGFDFFAPSEALVYHLWSREHRPTFQQVKADEDREARKAQSVKRVHALLGLLQREEEFDKNIGFSHFGLGSTRSLSDFEEWVGVDFKNGVVRGGEGRLDRHLSSVGSDEKWEFIDGMDALIAGDPKETKNVAGNVEALNLVMSFISNNAH